MAAGMTSPACIALDVRASVGSSIELFRPEAIEGLATIVAASAPTLPHRELVTLCKLGAWICAFDDAVDSGELDDDALELRIAQYDQLVRTRDCPELAFDPMARLLGEVLDELASTPISRPLWPLFVDQLGAACEAMRWERSAPAATALEDYLHHAARSSCVAFVVTAAAMLIGEPATLRVLPALQVAEHHSATIVRIANDLATWLREQTERCAANALRFTRDPELLRAHGSHAQAGLVTALERLAEVPVLAAFVSRFTTCFVTLYAHGDLTDVRADFGQATSQAA
jgi:hypothetical protein